MKNHIPSCFYRVSIKALILDTDGRFLLIKEDNGFWEFPGGGLDFGEEPADGLRREIHEEMWLEVTFIEPNPSFFFTFVSQKWSMFLANVLYETKVKDFDFTPSSECQEIRFFTIEEARKESLYSNVEKFLELYKDRISLDC